MGSFIEINDTLQLTSEQGFPKELDYEKHKVKPFLIADFQDKVFEFRNKPNIRVYKLPPVRNFLAHNIDDQWLYWGLVHILEVTHDNVNKVTSGKFKLIQIYTPEQMEHAHEYLHPSTAKPYLRK